jgi:hypothetical protein
VNLSLLSQVTDEWWSKAIGPLCGAAVTSSIALLIWWLNRRRPSFIEVRDIDTISLLRIGDSVRQRIVSTFDGRTVAELSQLELSIRNTSHEIVKDIRITFKFSGTVVVLECDLSGVNAEKDIIGSDQLTITIPYLNSHSHHKEQVNVKILCDGLPKKYTVNGRGEGWTTLRVNAEVRHLVEIAILGAIVFSSLVAVAVLASLHPRAPSTPYVKTLEYCAGIITTFACIATLRAYYIVIYKNWKKLSAVLKKRKAVPPPPS